jgi:hypothetical protein
MSEARWKFLPESAGIGFVHDCRSYLPVHAQGAIRAQRDFLADHHGIRVHRDTISARLKRYGEWLVESSVPGVSYICGGGGTDDFYGNDRWEVRTIPVVPFHVYSDWFFIKTAAQDGRRRQPTDTSSPAPSWNVGRPKTRK